MSTSAAASLAFASLTPKTLKSFSGAKPTSLFLHSLSFLKNPISVSSSFPHSARDYLSLSSRFVRKVFVSSEFDQDEEVFSDGDEPNFAPDLKLYVGNLPFTVDSSQLTGLFESVGNVEMVEVIYDKTTGRSRGFGFVTMSTADEVEAAAQQFNGYELDGRALRVNSGPPPQRDDFSSNRGSPRNDFSSNRGGPRGYSSSNRGGPRGDFSSNRGGPRGDFYSNRGGPRGDFYSNRGGPRGDFSSNRGGPRGGGSFNNPNRVYVGNLSWGVDDLALETLFSEQGKVVEAKVVCDRESGRSRGFGFVTYNSAEEVDNAIESLNGVDLEGRSIRVTAAETRPPRQF